MSQRYIDEPARNIPVLLENDVVIAGAGLAGSAAAIAAARSGARTILVERNNAAGGNATFGLIGGITNLFLTDEGEQVLGGIAAEIVEHLSRQRGVDWEWSEARGVPWLAFDTEALKLALDEMLEEAGAELLYDTFVAEPISQDNIITGVIVENKSGRQAILGQCVVDCTGDADVAAGAGVPFDYGGRTSPSLLFRLGNVALEKTARFLRQNLQQLHSNEEEAQARLAQIDKSLRIGMFTLWDQDGATLQPLVDQAIAAGDFALEAFGWPRLNRLGMAGLVSSGIVTINTGKTAVDTLNTQETTRAEIHGRKMAFYVADFLREYVPGFERCRVLATAGNLGVRVGRKVHTEYEYQLQDMQKQVRFDDGILRAAVGVMNIDVGQQAAWSNKVIEVPYRSLLPQSIEHLLMGSGRSFPLAPLRVVRETPVCMALGQAAGTAAALCANCGQSPRMLDIRVLQEALLAQDVYLGDSKRC